MSTHIDWRTEIDSSVEHLPDRPPADYVVAGRRALRRRRFGLAVGVAGLTAVVVGGGWAMTSGGSAPHSDAPVASDPAAPSPGETETDPAAPDSGETEQHPQEVSWAAGEPPARVSPAGELQIREGAVIHDRRDDLYPGKDTESVALDLTFNDKQWWILLEWDADGSSAAVSSAPGETADSFDEFISDNVAGGGMASSPAAESDEQFPYAGLVRYSTKGLVLNDDVEVVRRIENPLGLQSPKSSIGLVVEHAGATTWMLLTASHSGGSGSTEDEAQSGWPTFDLWLADNVALQTGRPRLALATLAEDGTLKPSEDGVQILEQEANPDLPDYVSDSATASGVAMLQWRGETWFVLAARYDGHDAVTTFAASKTGGADDIESFLDFARERADEGGLQ